MTTKLRSVLCVLFACAAMAAACGGGGGAKPAVIDGTGIYRLAIDGGEPVRVGDWEVDGYLAPDGSRIAGINRVDPGPTLTIADPDGANAVDAGFIARSDHPLWSPDSTKVAIRSAVDNSLLIFNADGSRAGAVGSDVAQVPRTAWSPDSTSIAYAVQIAAPGEGARIAVADVATGQVRATIATATEQPDQLSWSADGAKITFIARNEAGQSDVFVSNADGSGLGQVTNTADLEFSPALSPDGRAVVFTRGLGKIVRLDLETRAETVLYEWRAATGGSIDANAWSPDGATIAFVARPDDKLGVFTVDASGGSDARQLVAPSGNVIADLRWLNDGEIAFIAENQGPPDLTG